MEDALKRAEELHKTIQRQDPNHPERFDQILWMREKAASRECLVMGVAGVEALANSLLSEFACHKIEDIPTGLIKKRLRKLTIEWWPLGEKVYFTPALCNPLLSPPSKYFSNSSKMFRVFEELIEIRNSLVHGKPWPRLVLFRLNRNMIHTMNDDFPHQKWPESGIHKDLVCFNYDSAKIVRDNVSGIKNALLRHVPRAGKKYLSEEKIRLVSPIIDERGGDEKLLMADWKKFVDESKTGQGTD